MEQNNKAPSMEEKAESKSFFTKRNIVILVLATLVSIGLAAITLGIIFDPSIWGTFFINIGKGIRINFGVMWLTLLIVFAVWNIAYNSLPMWVRLKQMGVKIKWWQYILFSLSVSFFKGVTPANFVYDPYTIFWLKTQGVSTSRATSIMFSNALLWQASVLLVHIPSYVLVMVKYQAMLTLGPGAMALIVFMSIGILVDIIGCLVMALLCFSRHAHIFMSSVFNWFKKKLRLKYSSKAEIIEKYKNKATMRKEVIEFYSDKSSTVIIIFILVAYELSVYFILSPALALVNADNQFSFDAIYVYHSTNMALNANRLNLVPGFGLGLEPALYGLLKTLGGPNGGITGGSDAECTKFIQQGIVLWRAFFTYLPALLGLCAFAGLTSVQVRSYRKNKSSFIQEKYE